jgi:protease-4
MTMDSDQIVDRRRLRRKLSFWRVATFVVAALAVVAVAIVAGGEALRSGAPQIARIEISGFIAEDRPFGEMIDRLIEADGVKGVIVAINSTGGSTAGGESLYNALRRLAAAKPTVAQMGTVAASAAYMAALGTDHIVARRSTLTGSIGVIFEYPEVSELMDKLGINLEEIKSAPLKAEPSPFHPASEEARQVMAGIVNDTYRWFVDLVAERRNLPPAEALRLSDGRIYTGQQALQAKLIDAIGGEETAVSWLEERGVEADLPIREWTPVRDGGFFPAASSAALARWLAQQLGIEPAVLPLLGLEQAVPDRLKLDGLLSVWHASDAAGEAGGPAQ